MCVGSREVEPLFVHGDSTVPQVHTRVWLVCVVPDLVARTGVYRPDVVRHGEIQNAVDQQGGGLDDCVLVGLKGPSESESGNVLGCDLGQSTVSSAGIIAVVARPGVGRRVCNDSGIEPLGEKSAREKEQQGGGTQYLFRGKRFHISYRSVCR